MQHPIILGLLVAALGCGASVSGCRETDPATSSDDLVGGTVTPQHASAPLILMLGCTAARVGPREVLLAAHCVSDEAPPGQEIELVPGHALEGQAFDTVVDGGPVEDVIAQLRRRTQRATVDQAFVHPSYIAEHAGGPLHGRAVTSADIAVIRFRDPLDPAITTLPINGRPPSPGQAVTLTGFGCESHDSTTSRRVVLKSGPSKIITREEVIALASPYGGGYHDPLGAPESYWFFPGAMTGDVTDSVALCKGDSGGPVLVMRRGEATIVGVNAMGRPVSATDRRFIYAAATRVDDGSREHIATWLRGFGLAVDD